MSDLGYLVRLRRALIGWSWVVAHGAIVVDNGWQLTRRRALRAAVARVQHHVTDDLGRSPAAWRAREHGTDALTLDELLDLADQLQPRPKENP